MHDSGTVWFAIPSLLETFTPYSLPVSRRTTPKSYALPLFPFLLLTEDK